LAARVMEEIAGAGGGSAGVVSVGEWEAVTWAAMVGAWEVAGAAAPEAGTPLWCSCSKSPCAHSRWIASSTTQTRVSPRCNIFPVVLLEPALAALHRT
jgi:hypothetical protein